MSRHLPGAWICTNDPALTFKNHGRRPVQQNKIYLKDSEEFEIELHNPLPENVLAVISLDGKPIATSGLVIRSGQRIYLDCFYDDKKKFVFKTYDVESNDTVTQKAIAKNGLFEVQFYKEKILKKYEADKIVEHHHHHYPRWNGWHNGFYYTNGILSTGTTNGFGYGSITTTNATNNLVGTLRSASFNVNSNTSDSTAYFSNSSVTGGSVTMDSLSLDSGSLTVGTTADATYSSDYSANLADTLSFTSASLNTMETGQTDKGGNSNQQFVEIEMDFEDSILNKISYQLLPDSRRPIEKADIIDKVTISAKEIELNGNVKINNTSTSDKLSRLLDLKKLLDEKLLTKEEFDKLKTEII